MSFSRCYQSYKESKTTWLGDVPSHWHIKPLGYMFRRVKRTGYEKEALLSVYRDYGVILKNSRVDNINKASEDLSPYQLVNVGDLAVNKMKAWQGSVGISNHRGIVSPAYFIFEANHSENPNFLHYLMRSTRYIAGYLSISKGIRVGQWDLDPDHHAKMPVLLPPAIEQSAITSFLDRETNRIDSLITKKTKFIELLKEKRQAVIARAVTKGLNDFVSMKDSGIAWLGNIPENWKIKPLKNLFSRKKRIGYPEEELLSVYREFGVIVKSSGIDKINKPSEDLSVYQLVNVGDLAVNKMKAWQGSVGISEHRGIISPAYFIFESKHNQNNKFLHYLMRSKPYIFGYASISKGVRVGQWDLDPEHHVKMPILLPPSEEQETIVKFIDDQLARINNLLQKTERSIELLKEHRSALITAAVTGKIDVRETT